MIVTSFTGLVDADLLHFLSAELGDEWRRVAQHLGVKRVRIQAIMRNNVNCDIERTIYDMFVTWLKRVPKAAKKVSAFEFAAVTLKGSDMMF